MKAYIRLNDNAVEATPYETVKKIINSRLSYGWHLVSVNPATDQLCDYVVIAEKKGRADINTIPF